MWGVWIEMVKIAKGYWHQEVTPYVGVWIEMLCTK